MLSSSLRAQIATKRAHVATSASFAEGAQGFAFPHIGGGDRVFFTASGSAPRETRQAGQPALPATKLFNVPAHLAQCGDIESNPGPKRERPPTKEQIMQGKVCRITYTL